MSATTVRSGGSTVLRFVGGIFLLVGLAALVGSVVLAFSSNPIGAAIIVAGCGLLFAVLGGIFLVMGFRAGTVLDAEGITWTPTVGSRRSVPWAQVQQVVVPDDDDQRRCVQLLLRDGSAVDVKSVSKLQNSQTNRYMATRGYLAAGAQVVDAHRAWIAAQGGSR